MSFGFTCSFLILILGCFGIFAFCDASTSPVHLAGPMNMSFDGGDPLVTSIGLCVLIGATWIGSYFSRQWSPAQGLLVAATGFGVVIVMTLHHANLDDQIERISDGRLAPADAFSFWLFAVPAVVLFVLSWLRLKNWSARRA